MRKVMAIMIVTLFLAGIVAVVVPVRGGTTRYVPSQYATMQLAVDAASDGDAIVVAPGTYNEVVNVNKLLTLKGQEGAIVKPDGTTPLLDAGIRRVAIYVTHDDVIVEGFEVDGTLGTVHCGIYVFNANNAIVRNNVVHDMINDVYDVAGVGILFFGWGQGIDGAFIQRNTVFNTPRMGIFVGGMRPSDYKFLTSSNNIVKENTVHHAWIGPTNDGGGAIQINAAMKCVIDRNTIYETRRIPDYSSWFKVSIYLDGTAGENSVVHNDIHDNYVGIAVSTYGFGIDFGTNTPASPAVHTNKIYGNILYGLRAYGPPIVKAEANWWGDASGPYHSTLNPSGKGNEVRGDVDFMPWLRKAPPGIP